MVGILMSKISIPHIHTMHRKDFHALMQQEWIDLQNITEKTDGYAFRFGRDKDGFWSMSSQSGGNKMRTKYCYYDRVEARELETGKPGNRDAAKVFGSVHSLLALNRPLQAMLLLNGPDICIPGEVLLRRGKETWDDAKIFQPVGTRYYTEGVGSCGKFIVHTQHPNNTGQMNLDQKFGDDYINFDHDRFSLFGQVDEDLMYIDIERIAKYYNKLDHGLMLGRKTKKNAEQIDNERMQGQDFQNIVSDTVDAVFVNQLDIKPKWGPETEGYVVHPTEAYPKQPRFKVISTSFRKFKETV